MAELKNLIVNGSSRFNGPIYGKASSADTATQTVGILTVKQGSVTKGTFNGSASTTITLDACLPTANILSSVASSDNSHVIGAQAMYNSTTAITQSLNDLETGKQDKLTAGSYINITSGNVINAEIPANLTLSVCSITQSQYDALSSYDTHVIYAVTGAEGTYAVSQLTESATLTLDVGDVPTYGYVTITGTSIALAAGSNPVAGVEHYILLTNNGSSDCVLTPPSGSIAPKSTFTVKSGKSLEISYVYANSRLVFTVSADLITV